MDHIDELAKELNKKLQCLEGRVSHQQHQELLTHVVLDENGRTNSSRSKDKEKTIELSLSLKEAAAVWKVLLVVSRKNL